MKTPKWLAEIVAEKGAEVVTAKTPRASADAAVLAVTKRHPEFADDLAASTALRLLGKWIAEHTSSGDLLQAQLFPGLPAVMRVAPTRSSPVSDMTAEDLDHARNMLWARTENAVSGAKDAADRERAAFGRFYSKVRPLLSGDLKVSDVIGKLADGEENAA